MWPLGDIVDLTTIAKQMLQSVPFWSILIFIFNYWLKKSNKSHEEQLERLQRIESKIYQIEISLADAGMKDIRSNIEDLKEARALTDVQIKQLWKRLGQNYS